ncbi:DUF4286 family protein [Xanthobacter oligotrophicus]|uniref:DUF4286 family protein n=1 Tax=Xanthobacter oligotrophicus TaxID=2607286 RepID=UPI0011F0EADF|nr:DUF4286 family protein [Xanthobacter oligotrophicus]MCG5235640.1 hypothetical protein [Xanthobacter oligotrophicus]
MNGNLGFMGFWSDIDQDYQLRYQEWHNCEHIPERLGIPGFIEGRRYRGAPGGPNFFMCYITAGPEVLRSEAYLSALNRPTPWTKEALTHFRNPTRTLYRKLRAVRSEGGYAPYVLLLRFDDERPAEVLENQVVEALSGTGSAAVSGGLYEVDAEASGIMTAERRIYSGGPGSQRYLIAVEALDRAQAEAVAEHVERRLSPGIHDLDRSIYWLETRIRAEDLRGPARKDVQ